MLSAMLAAVIIAGLAGLPAPAQPPAKGDKEVGENTTQDNDKAKAPAGAMKLPSGALIVGTDKLSEVIQKGNGFFLTPERYKDLIDQIERLKKQIAADKPVAPSCCELDGMVEQRGGQAVVRLRAVFKFKTTQPHSVVALGCQKTAAVKAELDEGKLPQLLPPGETGLNVLVDEPAEHTLRLELETPAITRGSKGTERGFEIGLPGAPITTLTFAAPFEVKRLSIGRREIGSAAAASPEVRRVDAAHLAPGHGGEALGPITSLEVSWDDPAQPIPAQGPRSAEAEITVSIAEAEVQTEARLRLKGTAKEWRFVAPATAEVSVGKPPPPTGDLLAKPVELPYDQAPTLVRPDPNQPPIWKLQFKEAMAADLLVAVSARTPRPRATDAKGARGTFPVGPVAALDVQQQSGTIHVMTPPQIRATGIPKGDTRRQDSGDEPTRGVVFRYQSLPPGPNNLPGPPLELDIRPMAGTLYTQVRHQLQLAEEGWRLRTTIEVKPFYTEADWLELEVPADLQNLVGSPPDEVEGVAPVRDAGPARRVIQMRLASPRRRDFTVILEGLYPQAGDAREATLALPRVLGAFDHDGQVTVAVPEGFDVRGSVREWETNHASTWALPLEPRGGGLSARVNRAAGQIDLSWRPQQPDLRVDTVADVTLGNAQGRIILHMHCSNSGRAPTRLRLRGPEGIRNLAATPGTIEPAAPGEWFVGLPADTGREFSLKLTYTFDRPITRTGADGLHEVVPLVWLDGATQVEARVRFWRDPTAAPNRAAPVGADAPWQVLPPELVPERDTLPMLVLQASGNQLALSVRFTSRNGEEQTTGATSWVERALIQVQAGDESHRYRARFYLRRWQTPTMELALPMAAAAVEASLNGKPIDAPDTVRSDDGRPFLRIALPAWRPRRPVVVEVQYQLPAAGTRAELTPPLPAPGSGIAVAATRWEVALSRGSTPLSFSNTTVLEERWGWRHLFPSPQAARSVAELEAWFLNGQEPASEGSANWQMGEAAVAAREEGLHPLSLYLLPRTAMLIAASVVAFLTGLFLSRLRRRDATLALLGIGAVAALGTSAWPQPAGQLFAAALPGLVLLAIVLGSQRYLQWHYRWRLDHMPAFSRSTNSSLARTGSSLRSPLASAPVPPIHRETSTIDAPAHPEPWASSSSS
jgi:hypothetical protein